MRWFILLFFLFAISLNSYGANESVSTSDDGYYGNDWSKMDEDFDKSVKKKAKKHKKKSKSKGKK
ncbi:MAG TPA: hypothetical protein ENI73_02695 [Spirochaetes bacterium]|nr:hypothetical protein [Spirochaetota bacterium]